MSSTSDVFRQQANELLREALDLAEEERSAFLDERCADQPELREEVRLLLDSLKKAGQFLETPVLPRTSELFEEVTNLSARDRRIGPFRVKSVIASGGMGTVYEAEQAHPRRTVALKIINAGIASPNGLRRFEYEAQYLARLQHPNVAQVYDAGLHEEQTVLGPRELPYFAMEYIAGGRPITDITQIGELSLRQRLEMFLKVAAAVHHGHQKGIVHRDLKPSNILVDEHGEPKIIDYGVARLVGEERGEEMTHTVTGQLVGTLQYMSPEQCSPDPSDVDIRSDVYALGLVLFEMITDARPYSVKDLQLAEATRIIREQPPASMSSVGCRVPRDLETIVRKALEKSRDRRYQSAAHLHGDVQRFLNDEPIEARPPSMFYQLRMFARRNRTTVIAATAIGLILLLASLISTAFAIRASRQRNVAVWNSYVGNVAAAEAAYRAGEFRRMRNHLASAPEHLRGWEWRYLNRLAEPSIAVLTDHDHMASDVAFSPDGRLLATSSRDNTILVREFGSLRIAHRLLHTDATFGITFSPDGTRVVGGSRDGRIRVWSVASGDLIAELNGHDDMVTHLRFSADGELLASASFDHTARIWSARDWTEYRVLDGHTDHVRAVQFDREHRRLFTAGDDGRLIVWDVETGTVDREVQGHEQAIRDIAVSADFARLFCPSNDGSVSVWAAEDLRELRRINAGEVSIWSIALAPDESSIAIGRADHTIMLIGLSGDGAPRTLRGHGDLVHGVAFHPDGATLASASWDRTVRIWDARPNERFEVLRAGSEEMLDVAVSPLGDRAATVGRDGLLRIWNLDTGSIIAAIEVRDTDLYGVDFSRDGQRIAVGSTDNLVRVFDAATGRQDALLRGHEDTVYSVAFLADGAQVVSASEDGTARIWDIAAERAIHVLDRHTDGVWDVAVSPDGRTIATASRDTRAMLWDASTGAFLREMRGHRQDLYAAAFSPDGLLLATGSRDQSIRIWNVNDGAEVAEMTGHGQFVTDLAFMPDGARLVTVSWFQTIKFWDVNRWQEVSSLLAHEGSIRGVAITPDGTRALTAAHDGDTRIWDVLTVQQRRERAQDAIRRRDAAEQLLAKISEKSSDAAEIAQWIREDASLNDRTRQDALNALLAREHK